MAVNQRRHQYEHMMLHTVNEVFWLGKFAPDELPAIIYALFKYHLVQQEQQNDKSNSNHYLITICLVNINSKFVTRALILALDDKQRRLLKLILSLFLSFLT